ncbi:MAG: hypothetical protein AB1757_09050 [Acidobacteriota bacterium]
MTKSTMWAVSPDAASSETLITTNSRIQRLESRLSYLEAQIPNSILLSHKFWRRAFAVFGHQFCAALAIYSVLLVVALLIGIVFTILGALMSQQF